MKEMIDSARMVCKWSEIQCKNSARYGARMVRDMVQERCKIWYKNCASYGARICEIWCKNGARCVICNDARTVKTDPKKH